MTYFSRRLRLLCSLLGLATALISLLLYRIGHAETVIAVASSPRPLVFIHGIKGAALVNDLGETFWLTPWQTLNFGTLPLSLPRQWNGDVQAKDDLKPGKILGPLRVIPWILESSIYGPWLAAARAFHRPFYAFAYDWRRDPQESADLFEKFLEKVQVDHGGQRPQVVAHSLGGLITLAVLNKRPELFGGVYFAGVPFSGGVGFLPDLVEGEPTGLNSRILSPEVVGTFPSMYAFLPLDGSGIVDRLGKPFPIDFFDATQWRKNGWGVFHSRGDGDAKEAFLKVALAHARAFRERLNPRAVSATGYPQIWVIASREHATLAEVVHHGKKFDFNSRPKQPGDERVCEKNAMPPAGIPFQMQYTEADHAGLLNDPKVIALIGGINASSTAGKSSSGR